VVVPVSTGLVSLGQFIRFSCGGARGPIVDRSVGVPPLTSIGCCCGWRLTPVVCAGIDRTSSSLVRFRSPADSHVLIL
jgi:hypothetical protein